MPARLKKSCIVFAVSLLTFPVFGAGEASLMDMSLEELMNIHVQTASLISQKLSEAPAVMTVISNDEMVLWGDRSVADALSRVPGFYVIDNHTTKSVGVRGLFGGQHSDNSQIKVMIDGQPTAFRPDDSNFLGPEFLPLSVIDRIEVVRGPGSALYGADAFLAVVNIITRNAASGHSAVDGTLRLYDQSGNTKGIDANVRAHAGNFSLMLAAQKTDGHDLGSTLPSSSPDLKSNLAFFTGRSSEGAPQSPLSALVRMGWDAGSVSQHLDWHESRIDSTAEFLDFGTLTHQNRYAEEQQQIAYHLNWAITDHWSIVARASNTVAEPGPDEQLYTGSATSYPRRDFHSNADDAGVTLNWAVNTRDSLSVGADWVSDHERTLQIFQVATATGKQTLTTAPSRDLKLTNDGEFLQYALYPTDKLGLTFNIRQDHQSLYGDNNNWRIGAVYALSPTLTFKGILSTSYEAPSVYDLYGVPLYNGDLVGNPLLKPQQARNDEMQVSWLPAADWQLSLNIYRLDVRNKIEYAPNGLDYQPFNIADFKGDGAEAEVRYSKDNQRITLGLAWNDMQSYQPLTLVGTLVSQEERFPERTVYIGWQYHSDRWGQFGAELNYAGRRYSTYSNGVLNYLTPYSLSPYTRVALVYSKDWGRHEVQFRLDNATNVSYSDPGYGGVDIPGMGRSLTLNYRYRWE